MAEELNTALSSVTKIVDMKIDANEYKSLVNAILESQVSGDRSAFADVASKMTEYLEEASGMDSVQKAGVYSKFLKESYAQVNANAMNTALKILEINRTAELEVIKANQAVLDGKIAQLLAEKVYDLKLVEEVIAGDKKDAGVEELKLMKLKVLEQATTLKKQFGVEPKIDGSVYSITNTTKEGALDKQIQGYDDINKKDALKVVMEGMTMLANAEAQVIPSWMGQFILNAVSDFSDKEIRSYKISGAGTDQVESTTEYVDINGEDAAYIINSNPR